MLRDLEAEQDTDSLGHAGGHGKTVVEVLASAIESMRLPEPILSSEATAHLTPRDREILRDLATIFIERGFAEFRLADLAAELRCSLRALYRIGRNKEDLFLAVLDRIAYTFGATAAAAVRPGMTALEAVEAYLRAGNEMVGIFQGQLGLDVAASPKAAARNDAYAAGGIDIVHALLDFAVERGEIPTVNTGALARMLAGAARDFTRPEAMRILKTSPQQAANEMVELVLAGLRSDTKHSGARTSDQLAHAGGQP